MSHGKFFTHYKSVLTILIIIIMELKKKKKKTWSKIIACCTQQSMVELSHMAGVLTSDLGICIFHATFLPSLPARLT